TEVGYVGRDVESIIRDLADFAVKMVRDRQIQKVRDKAFDAAEDRVLDILLPGSRTHGENGTVEQNNTRQVFRKKLREGDLDDKEIEIKVSEMIGGVEIMAPPGMEEMTSQLSNLFSNLGSGRKKMRRVNVKAALKILQDEEAAKLVNEEEVKALAIEATEQTGIVFIDEI